MNARSSVREDPSDPLIGQTFGGKYTIKKLIGRGGVGLVYLADQKGDAKEVVVKILAPNWAQDDEAQSRFEREAKRLNGLRHPNIVAMFDYGREGPHSYLVMEYCKGELLSDYVERNGSLTLEQFVPVAAQILKGIGHCHSREMMVRDIKPANVMLVERKGRANFVKILDFGLAKLIKDEHQVTEEHVLGTVGYLSPEQIKGEELDLRVDVYALGILFYYMLSGGLPFDGETNATVFYKTVNEPPPDLREAVAQAEALPDGLVDVIHGCLLKDRDKRPADADAIVEHLIDVVPAALFRLPRADTARHDVATVPGRGNTGMMELLGTDKSPSGPIPAAPSAPIEAAPEVEPKPDTAEVPPLAAVEMPEAPMALGDGSGSSRTWLIVAVLLLLGGVGAWVVTSGSSTTDAGAQAGASKAEGAEGGVAVAAALDDVAGHLEAGRVDAAATRLDEVAEEAAAVPKLRGRATRLRQQIETTRLMETAAKLEADGKPEAAKGAYRDVLAVDASHQEARAALARLETGESGGAAVPPTPTPPPEGTPVGSVAISATPAAKVLVNGESHGTTPFSGELPVGVHEIRLTARGHITWEGMLEVTKDGAKPLAVALERKRKGRSGSSSKPSSSKPSSSKPSSAPASSGPTPKAPSEPAAQPDSAGKKPGPFLPTKKKEGDKVFLPTKD